jgi:transposase
MIQIEFTEEEIQPLHHERRPHPDPRVRQRGEIVSLKALGYSHQEIGPMARVSPPTVREALPRDQEGGLEKLKEGPGHQSTSELEAYREVLEAEFRARPPQTIHEAVDRIEKLTGLRRSPTQGRPFLKSLGMKRLQVGSIPSQAHGEKPAQFLEQKIEPRWEEARQGKRHVCFGEGAPFVWQAFLGFLGCFTRVFIPAPSGRPRLSVLGAWHALTHEVVTVVTEDYLNAETVKALLHQLKASFGDLPITIFLDNARYQPGQAVRAVAAEWGIERIFLPSYSPNLNLIERLWKFVKKECLYSQYYETFAAFKSAILECLQETQGKHKDKLAPLLTLNFQGVENETL